MDVGATIALSMGKKTAFITISGIYDAKKIPSGHGPMALDAAVIFAPEELFHEFFPEIESFDFSWSIVSDSQKKHDEKVALENVITKHSNLALDTIDSIIEYEETQNALFFGSMQSFSWLIFLFGVVNLINTTLSNQISRKQENSILHSIGLTEKQLCQMNVSEGICYAIFAILATMLVGFPISMIVCREVSKIVFDGAIVPYQFPVIEMGLFVLALFSIELILSVWTIFRQKKHSVTPLSLSEKRSGQ